MIPHLYPLFLGGLIVLISAVLLLSIVRRYRRELGLEKQKKEKTQESAFIINAFHELTKQLKEKEKELERLKSLAEQRADTVESYNENILQCVTSGVMTFDTGCTLTTMNRAAEEILKIPRTQAIGSSCSDVLANDELCGAIRQTLENKSPLLRVETSLDRQGGKLWLGYNTAILTDGRGEAIGVILSFSDLTEVKLLQEQMELRERLTALGEMSAGIAHELRNPMAVIAGYLKLLSKKTDAQSQSVIRDITKEIDGMNRIIGDLLTFARPASLNRVAVDVKGLIEGCVSANLQSSNQAKIRTELDVDDATLALDEGLMRQAVGNLIQNAVEAMPEGGTLAVNGRAGKHFRLSITDTGCGIPPNTIKKVFLPFFTTKDNGVGLGLALVHKIILSHGGRIDVTSAEGKGTTFTIVLPRG